MSSVQKVKEFFGLVSYEEDDHDAYYADEAAYSAAPAPSYADRHTMPYDYQPEYQVPPRVYEAAVVRVSLRSYTEASRIGEPFRDGDVVVFDITEVQSADAKRIVDFAAGVCFGLRGKMEKVAPRVFAVIPENAHVSQMELERAANLR
jgi:cell division protein sepF